VYLYAVGRCIAAAICVDEMCHGADVWLWSEKKILAKNNEFKKKIEPQGSRGLSRERWGVARFFVLHNISKTHTRFSTTKCRVDAYIIQAYTAN